MVKFVKSIMYKREEGMKKADVSRLLFFMSWLMGSAVVFINIFMPVQVTPQGLIVPAVSDATFNFLIFFISTFTVNYLGRRATDAWKNTKVPEPASPSAPQNPQAVAMDLISVAPPVAPRPDGLSNVGNYHSTPHP